jgi:nucleoside-diphosphate-sugar epimerase
MSVELMNEQSSVRVLNAHEVTSFRDDGTSFMYAVRNFLRDASAATVTHVVLVSSTMVYGAWENNASPLSEYDLVRPNPECELVCAFASAEALVEQWRTREPGRTATVLRAAPIVDRDGTSSWVTALAHAAGSELSSSLAGAQFVHATDVNSAIDLCVQLRVDGIVNVAPDGFITGDRLRELAAHPLQVRLPEAVRAAVDSARWTVERGPIPPGLREYVRHSWVVSNDKLKSLGWRETFSNEEAYVEGTEGSILDGLSARRRQEIALVGSAVAILGVVRLVLAVIRRVRGR